MTGRRKLAAKARMEMSNYQTVITHIDRSDDWNCDGPAPHNHTAIANES